MLAILLIGQSLRTAAALPFIKRLASRRVTVDDNTTIKDMFPDAYEESMKRVNALVERADTLGSEKYAHLLSAQDSFKNIEQIQDAEDYVPGSEASVKNLKMLAKNYRDVADSFAALAKLEEELCEIKKGFEEEHRFVDAFDPDGYA